MEPGFPRSALFVTAGLLVWAADFLFIYAFSALACARGIAHLAVAGIGIVQLASITSTVVAAAATGAVIMVGVRRADMRSRAQTPTPIFIGQLAAIVAILALLAVAFTGLPGLLISQPC